HGADRPRRAEVGGQHGGEDHAVDDHRFGEFGKHFVLLVSRYSLTNPPFRPPPFCGSEHGPAFGARRPACPWYQAVPGPGAGIQPTGRRPGTTPTVILKSCCARSTGCPRSTG